MSTIHIKQDEVICSYRIFINTPEDPVLPTAVSGDVEICRLVEKLPFVRSCTRRDGFVELVMRYPSGADYASSEPDVQFICKVLQGVTN